MSLVSDGLVLELRMLSFVFSKPKFVAALSKCAMRVGELTIHAKRKARNNNDSGSIISATV